MNTNTSLFLARDHAAELIGEADRERLARQARETRPTADRAAGGRLAATRWSVLSGLREVVASR
jgi:hypothetical protein